VRNHDNERLAVWGYVVGPRTVFSLDAFDRQGSSFQDFERRLRLKVHGNDLRCSGTGTKLSFHVKKLLSTRIPKWIPSGLSGHLEFGPSRWKWLHVDLIYACFFVGSVCEPVSIG